MRSILAISAAGVAAAALCLSGCSSSGSSHSATSAATASAGAASSSAASSGGVVSMKGGVLVSADGHTLYVNTVDTTTAIKCTGTCATLWPPLDGPVTAGSGVPQSDLGTASRPDGSMQATFQGHPLYHFSGDSAAGDKKGNGLADQGGSWHVATVGAASSTSGSSSGGGSGPTY